MLVIPAHRPNFRVKDAKYGFGAICEVDVADCVRALPHGGHVISDFMLGRASAHAEQNWLAVIYEWGESGDSPEEGTICAPVGTFVWVGDPKDDTVGVTFGVRARNEEATIYEALVSLGQYSDPYDILVTLHCCTDRTKEIVERFAANELPARARIRVLETDEPISRAGLETFATEPDHPRSLMKYYTEKAAYARRTRWYFKWDADFIMTPGLATYLEGLELAARHEPSVVSIPSKFISGDRDSPTEPWLSNVLTHYGKSIFWEVPCYRSSSGPITQLAAPKEATFIHNDGKFKKNKKYWGDPPWYETEGLREHWLCARARFTQEVLLRGVDAGQGFARQSNPKCDVVQWAIGHIPLEELDRRVLKHLGGVTMVLTACNRPELLRRTLESFVQHNTYPLDAAIIVEASGVPGVDDFAHELCPFPLEIVYLPKRTPQVDAIDHAYGLVKTPYIFHCEEDWEFLAPSFIERSIAALHWPHGKIFTVWLRPHHCTSGHPIAYGEPAPVGCYMMDRAFSYETGGGGREEWAGVTWNPGLRLTSVARMFHPLRQHGIGSENGLDRAMAALGYRAAILKHPGGHVTHIGWEHHVAE